MFQCQPQNFSRKKKKKKKKKKTCSEKVSYIFYEKTPIIFKKMETETELFYISGNGTL